MEDTWVTVSVGLPGVVMAKRAALEANGIPTFVPDETMKAWDPFITGANALDSLLQVPASALEEARRILEEHEQERLPPAPIDEARRLATRMAFASMWVVTAPFTLYLAPLYFERVRRAGARPSNHHFALLALGLAIVTTVGAVLYALSGLLVREG